MKIISQKNLVYSFSKKNPIAGYISPGQSFEVETHKRFSNRRNFSNILSDDSSELNAITGNIFVKGALPGSTLEIHIIDIGLTDNKGIILAHPNKGAFKEKISKPHKKVVHYDKNFAYFNNKIKLPLSPMIGRIGVAPKKGVFPCGTCGPYGGNMDNNLIKKGAKVYIPIFVEGAHLALGDIHALMGDGESLLSGLETSGTVTMKCNLNNKLKLTHPLVETKKEIMTVADGKTIEKASKIALDNMASLLVKYLDLKYIDAAMLISISADLKICQIVNPRVCVKVVLPKSILKI